MLTQLNSHCFLKRDKLPFLLYLFIWQLAFPDAIYLVDAIQGGEMLVKACKPALESSYITKVIHDCKRDSEVSISFY